MSNPPSKPPDRPSVLDDIEIAVLLYGDFPHLAERCLGSILPLYNAGVRTTVYANDPSPATLAVALGMGYDPIVFSPQIYKYPVLKLTVAAAVRPFLMWFDDDSYIKHEDKLGWLRMVNVERQVKKADLMGSVYTQALMGGQAKWVRTRPWFKGKPVRQVPSFVQGAWWLARTAFLRELGWPDADIRHNGGDVMLGVACDQAGGKMVKFREGVAINADDAGNESKSKRRGHSEPPVGKNA